MNRCVCAVAAHSGHRGSGTYLTLLGRGSGTWATLVSLRGGSTTRQSPPSSLWSFAPTGPNEAGHARGVEVGGTALEGGCARSSTAPGRCRRGKAWRAPPGSAIARRRPGGRRSSTARGCPDPRSERGTAPDPASRRLPPAHPFLSRPPPVGRRASGSRYGTDCSNRGRWRATTRATRYRAQCPPHFAGYRATQARPRACLSERRRCEHRQGAGHRMPTGGKADRGARTEAVSSRRGDPRWSNAAIRTAVVPALERSIHHSASASCLTSWSQPTPADCQTGHGLLSHGARVAFNPARKELSTNPLAQSCLVSRLVFPRLRSCR